MRSFVIESLADIDKTAAQVMLAIPNERIVCLYGPMGSGKTTLIKALCKCLGVVDNVVSPTFAIINEYKTTTGSPVYHFDFYRIKKIEEAFDLGYEEYFYSHLGICFIEWPELVEELLPTQGVVKLQISAQANGARLVEIYQGKG